MTKKKNKKIYKLYKPEIQRNCKEYRKLEREERKCKKSINSSICDQIAKRQRRNDFKKYDELFRVKCQLRKIVSRI